MTDMSKIPYTDSATRDKFRPEQLDGMKRVTQNEFFAYVGTRDIVTTVPSLYYLQFETRNRNLVCRVYDL